MGKLGLGFTFEVGIFRIIGSTQLVEVKFILKLGISLIGNNEANSLKMLRLTTYPDPSNCQCAINNHIGI